MINFPSAIILSTLFVSFSHNMSDVASTKVSFLVEVYFQVSENIARLAAS